MRSFIIASLLACSVGAVAGCGGSTYRGRLAPYAPDTGMHDLWDATFRRRHEDPKHLVHGDPMLELAREVTMLEDDIRRDGSITIKSPDVWGDGNLIASIQEYDRLMGIGSNIDSRFSETVQAYIARSDYGEFQSTTAIAQALSGAPATNVTSTTVADVNKNNALPTSTLPSSPGPFDLIKTSIAATPTKPAGIGLEPTELDRERSTFILANQSLRRRMIGDDNSRAAGYGLYLFRIPVSVIPGRETTEGYSAVVNLRAQLRVDSNHLRNTFPKMVIADLVDSLTQRVQGNWDSAKKNRATIAQIVKRKRAEGDKLVTEGLALQSYKDKISQLDEKSESQGPLKNLSFAPGISQGTTSIALQTTYNSHSILFGEDVIDNLVDQAIEQFETEPAAYVLNPPKPAEVRQYLYAVLEQTHNVLLENRVYEDHAALIAAAGDYFVKGRYDLVAEQRDLWRSSIAYLNLDPVYHNASWLLALQSGIANQNMKKILNDLQSKGYTEGPCAVSNEVYFFAPDTYAVSLWETIIRETFPLQVFNLDPITEEQNAYDAFARRRELQVALAFSVAKGSVFGADEKLKMSRKLALDESTIALNRTAVAFAHGDDTFGWYFHPRVQTPPTESSNIGALARTLWSTGPTDCYDRKHRRLEPGMRNCEVLIAMPSFVNEVAFDVTSNWEKIARPGVTKRSYEEMLAQGGRLHRLRSCIKEPNNQLCYRPGDLERLSSRIDQLENMLGMQTHNVNLPYQYEQSVSGLFDTGRKQLRPTIDYYYGLSYLDPQQSKAEFFITGKNFHPTLTHVVVGGVEKHQLDGDSVEIINRELIRVRVEGLNEKVSQASHFEVRVSTPAGISNLLVIEKASKPVSVSPPYDWKSSVNFTGYLCKDSGKTVIHINESDSELQIKTSLAPEISQNGELAFTAKVKFKSGAEKDLKNFSSIQMNAFGVETSSFVDKLNESIGDSKFGIYETDEPEGVITCTGYLNGTPPIKLPTQITITFSKVTLPSTKCPKCDGCDKPTMDSKAKSPDQSSSTNEPIQSEQVPAPEPNAAPITIPSSPPILPNAPAPGIVDPTPAPRSSQRPRRTGQSVMPVNKAFPIDTTLR